MLPPSEFMIGNRRFTEALGAGVVRGKPLARYSQTRTACALTFSAALVAEFPDLTAAKRVSVFMADGPTKQSVPSVALFPCADDLGTAFLNDGKGNASPRRKIQGRMLARLSAFVRIDFRVEQIESPGRGWLLTPVESERKIP